MANAQSSTQGPAIQQMGSPIEDLIARLKLKKNPYPSRSKQVTHRETKWIEWDFSKAPFKTLELIQITDVQWGHICCKRERVREYRDWVLAAPNRYMIWTGDNIDSATMQSKGTTWENTGTPQQQLFEFCQEWAPARHRI